MLTENPLLEHHCSSIVNFEVSKHIYADNPSHTEDLQTVHILDTLHDSFRRGV